ncbi:MAG: type II toxin-antitoxin system RelE/ParE family toxin [Desulfobacterales bacterium]|jgi:plasmid stabilization system protein ParE|nr:type II toxin-antitoxin system RelE/ParE family toxin [Desulfobacterales bacterium]
MKIEWVRLAWIDLEDAIDFIAHDKPEAARKTAKRILEAVRVLAEHPGAGRAGRVPGTRELVVGGTPFILPYRVKDNAVQILRVLHASRQWPPSF